MLTLLTTLWMAPPAVAQELKAPELMAKLSAFDVQTRAFTLPSGMRVILQEDPEIDNVTVASVVGLGLQQHPAAVHLLEHLTWHSQVGDNTAMEHLTAAGATFNGLAVADWTLFITSGPASQLDTLLTIEASRLSDPLKGVSEEQLVHERAVIQIEPNYLDIGSWAGAWPYIFGGLFGEDHPQYGRMSEVVVDTVGTVERADLDALVKTFWKPDEMTLVVMGNVDFDEATSTLFEVLGPQMVHADATEDDRQRFLKPGIVDADVNNPDHVLYWFTDPDTGEALALEDREITRLSPGHQIPDRAPAGTRPIHIYGHVDTPIAVVAWAVPGPWRGEDRMSRIAAQALMQAGFQDWALQWDIKKTASGGPTVGCNISPAANTTIVVCTATARDNRVNGEELADRLLAASAVFWDPAQEMIQERATIVGQRAALKDLITGLDRRLDPVTGRAATVALNAHFQGNPTWTGQLMNDVMTVERHDIRPWVQEWLEERRAVRIVINPLPPGQRLALTSNSAYHADLLPRTIPGTEVAPTNEEVLAAYDALDLSNAEVTTLENGLEVVAVPHGQPPVVMTALVGQGGLAYGQGTDILSHLMTFNLGNLAYSNADNFILDPVHIAGEFVPSRDSHLSYETLRAPSGNLDGALYLLRRSANARKVVLGGQFRWAKATKLQLPISWSNRAWWAERLRLETAFGDHPVIWAVGREDVERLRELPNSEIQAWQKQKFNPENAKLFVLGDIDAAKATALAEEYWSGWDPSKKAMPALPESPAPSGSATYLLAGEDMPHTVISALCPVAQTTAEGRATGDVLGGLLTDHINDVLSEGGVSPLAVVSQTTDRTPLAWLQTTMMVPHGQAEAAMTALQTSLDHASEGAFDPVSLQQHKLRVAGEASLKLVDLPATLQLLAETYMLPGRGDDWFDRYGQALAGLDSEDFKTHVGQCAANTVYTVEGPLETLSPHAEAWGAEVFDWVSAGDAELEIFDKKAYKRLLKARAKAAAK